GICCQWRGHCRRLAPTPTLPRRRGREKKRLPCGTLLPPPPPAGEGWGGGKPATTNDRQTDERAPSTHAGEEPKTSRLEALPQKPRTASRAAPAGSAGLPAARA